MGNAVNYGSEQFFMYSTIVTECFHNKCFKLSTLRSVYIPWGCESDMILSVMTYIKGFSFGLKNFKISLSARIPLAKILAFFIKFDFFLHSFALSFYSYLIECFSIVRSFCFCSSCNFGFLMGGGDDFFFFFLIEEKLLLLLFTFSQMS